MLLEWDQRGACAMITLTYNDSSIPRTTKKSTVALFARPEKLKEALEIEGIAGEAFGASTLRKSMEFQNYEPRDILPWGEVDQVTKKAWEKAFYKYAKKEAAKHLRRIMPDIVPGIKTDTLERDYALKRLERQGYPSHLVINQPGAPTLSPVDVSKFIRSLRKKVRADGHNLTYHYAGEYGGKRGRPHYHILLFPRDTQTEFTDEDWADYLWGDEEKSPLKSSWTKCDWNTQEQEKACMPFDGDMAKYVAKYTVKREKGLAPPRDFLTGKAIRADGSKAEYLQASTNPGIGYDSIPGIAEQLRAQAKIMCSLKPDLRAEIIQLLKENDELANAREEMNNWISKNNPGLTLENISAVRDVFQVWKGRIKIVCGGKTGYYKLTPEWRNKFAESVGIDRELRREFTKVHTLINQIRESRKSEEQIQSENENAAKAARRWKKTFWEMNSAKTSAEG